MLLSFKIIKQTYAIKNLNSWTFCAKACVFQILIKCIFLELFKKQTMLKTHIFEIQNQLKTTQ